MSNFMPYHKYESYGDNSNKKDKTENALSLLHYDLLFFIIKSELTSSFPAKQILHFDKKKNKHYIKGRIVKLEGMTVLNGFSFLDFLDFSKFNNEKKIEHKRNMVHKISFSYIETLILKMEDLDFL